MPTPAAPRVFCLAGLVISVIGCLFSLAYNFSNPEPFEFHLFEIKDLATPAVRRRVFLFGIDGIGNQARDMTLPTIGRIASQGISSWNVQTVSPTFSVECWTSMLHGVSPAVHKMSTFERGRKVPVESGYPSILKVAAVSGLETAVVVNWKVIPQRLVEDGIPGCRKVSIETGEGLVGEFTRVVRSTNVSFLFMQFDDTDIAGHYHGFFGDQQKRAIRVVDEQLGRMLDVISKLDGQNYVMVTTDHGGGGGEANMHGTDDPKDKTVFWICSGPGLTRTNIDQMSTLDIPVIAATILGLTIPPEWEGHVPQEIKKLIAHI